MPTQFAVEKTYSNSVDICDDSLSAVIRPLILLEDTSAVVVAAIQYNGQLFSAQQQDFG